MLCEDTRHTKGLLDRHGIEAKLLSYHQHNEAARTAELLPRLEAGERIALVSDAGLPGVNDPGARLIRAALEAGVPVTVLPGAVRGRDGARRERPRRRALPVPRLPAAGRAGARARSGTSSRASAHPAVAFESPQRLPATLRSLAEALPDRAVAVCRELTKRFEEVVRGHRRARSPRGSPRRRRARSRSSSAGRRSRRGRRTRARPSRRSASSSRRASPGARRPTWSPGSREFPVTLSMRNR